MHKVLVKIILLTEHSYTEENFWIYDSWKCMIIMKKSFENLYTYIFFFCFLPDLMLTSLFSNIISSWSQATRTLSFSVNSFADSLNFIFSYSAFTLLVMTIIFKNYFLECLPFMQNSLLDWRRQWQPTPVLLPGKSHGRRSLVGYSPWGGEESKSRTWLTDFTFTFHFHALDKEMATNFCILAWRIPGTEEPGGLPSMELPRVRHNWSDLAAAAAAFRLPFLSPILVHWYLAPNENLPVTFSQ